MLQELTIEYNMEDYLETIKDFNLMAHNIEGYGQFPDTIYIRDSSISEKIYSIREKSHKELSEGWSRLAKM